MAITGKKRKSDREKYAWREKHTESTCVGEPLLWSFGRRIYP